MAMVVNDDVIGIERLELGPWGTNAYIVVCRQTADSMVVDAPAEASLIIDRLAGSNPRYILLTHDHFDHMGALADIRSELGVPLAAHAADASRIVPPPEIMLDDDDQLAVGKLVITVQHTPGHTPGSLCFVVGKYLISGDTIFPGGPGKTGSPDKLRQIVKSISDKIMVLPNDTRILPGHGEPTTLTREKQEFAVFNSRLHNPNLCGDVLWLDS